MSKNGYKVLLETINIRKISRNSYNLFMLYKSLDNQNIFIHVSNRPFARWRYFTTGTFTTRMHFVSPSTFKCCNPSEV